MVDDAGRCVEQSGGKTGAVFQYPYYPYLYYLVGRSNSNQGEISVLKGPGWCTQNG